MALLTDSLVGLTSILSGLSELGIVKKHLLRASREVLLAVQGLLEVVEQYVGEKPDSQQSLHSVLTYAQKMIRHVAHQLPRGDEDEYRSLHRKVMNSILEVIEGEIRKNKRRRQTGHANQTSQTAKMKVEVLEAIRNVLLKEVYEQQTQKTGGAA